MERDMKMNEMNEKSPKIISVIGIGPGGMRGMTLEAADALEDSDTIVGYTAYTDLVRPMFPGKHYLSTPMTKEADRCRAAFEETEKGHKTAVICSGDAGVYGMASLMIMIGRDYPDTEIRIIPGVTAALSGAALLGAQLTGDFCLISLSAYLTPEEVIEKRLKAAADGDLVIVLYNPMSRKRPDSLKKACDILLQYRSADTVCGMTERIGRDGQSSEILNLGELRNRDVDMFTTVFIGNSATVLERGRMVTKRGYRL